MGRFKSKLHAISVNVIVIPAIIVTILLHAFIIVNSVIVNNTSQNLSQSMEEYGECSEIATLLQGGTSTLSETSTSFVMSDGNAVASLLSYINEYEMRLDRRGNNILSELEKHDILKTDGTDGPLVSFWNNINSAVEKSDKMRETQLRAIKIILSIRPRTAAELHNSNENRSVNLAEYKIYEFLTKVDAVELTAEEIAMSDDAKLAYVQRDIMFSDEYSGYKQGVSLEVGAAVSALDTVRNESVSSSTETVKFWRTMLLISTSVIIVIMAITFIVIFALLVRPVVMIANKIKADEPLDDQTGLYETRFLSYSYNELLKRRDLLEEDLRYMAETDALTKLPNRFTFNNSIEKLRTQKDTPVIFFSFDINGLKATNDNKGHLAGDELIRTSAECILNTFGNYEHRNCFRIGGDEFAAILTNQSDKIIDSLIEKFEQTQKKYGISIAYGYAFTDDISKTTFESLFIEADMRMYDCKIKMK